MLGPYDVKDIYAIQTTVLDPNGRPVPGLAIHFTFRGKEGYSIALTKQQFTAQAARDAVNIYAAQLAKLEDGES